jgi:hypothetical protein
MKLQVVTVSVNYSDFLVHTIEQNKRLFDRWIIVTDTKDTITKQLCDKHGVTCIQTDVFYENGGIFNKYAGVNEGLKYVDDDAWVLFLDSDIYLHKETRRLLEQLQLEKDCAYGMDRLNVYGYNEWMDYKSREDILKENWMLMTRDLDFGARLVHHYGGPGDNGKFRGWRPLGYFQLVHRSAFDKYSQNSIGADHCDLEFIKKWPRNKRILIPELYVIHLESVNAKWGSNWYGRKSKPFLAEEKDPEQEAMMKSLLEVIDKKLSFYDNLRKLVNKINVL